MKITGKLIIFPLLADIAVGTTVYVDDEAFHIYNGELLLCTEYPYSLFRNSDTNQTIPVTRVSADREGFDIDFSKFNIPIAQRTLHLDDWERFLADPWYIGPMDIETELHDRKNNHQLYSRMIFGELLSELIAINTEINMESKPEEANCRLKVLRIYLKKEISAMDHDARKSIESTFAPLSQDALDAGNFAMAGDPVLHEFITGLLEQEPCDYAHMKTKELEELLTEEGKRDEPDFEKCKKLRDLIKDRVGSPAN
jgi:hypothetical protein